MECLEHIGFKVEYVCIDNECKNKFQCSQCFQQDQNHNLVKYMEFYQFLVDYCHNSQSKYTMEQISQYIHGKSLEKKLYFFNMKKLKPEEDFHELYIKKLCQNFDQFSNELQQIVLNAKNDLVSRYQRQVEEQFDKQVLNFQLYQRRGCQLIINQIQKSNTQHANENLQKLHTGQYEVSFAKKALFESYYEIRDQLEQTINQCRLYLQKLIKQIVVLSDKRIIDKQNEVLQSISQRLGNKADIQHKRANIQVRLLSSEISKNQSQSPSNNILNQQNKLNPISTNTSQLLNKQISQLNQKSLTQRSQILSKSPISQAANISSMYFSPQNKNQESKQDLSFSSTYYNSMGFQQISRPLSSKTKYNFLLKDSIFQRDRSISQKNPKSTFSEINYQATNTSVESDKKPDKLTKKLIKMGFMAKKKQGQQISDEESSSDSSQESQAADGEEKSEQQKILPQGSLKSIIYQNVSNPNLLSYYTLQDIPVNVISLSSNTFLVTCPKSMQLKSFKMEENNKIALKTVFSCNNLLHMQKSLISGLFYLYGSIKTPKGENVNVIKLYQLSEQGLPIEIIEMRDFQREELETLLPFDEYTQLSNKIMPNFNPYDNLNSNLAINYMQFVGIFQESKGFRTFKLWEMQLKNGNIKNTQISCINSFQIEIGNEQIGWANLYKKKQYIIFTSNTIFKISYLKLQKDGQDQYQHYIQKRVFKFVNYKHSRAERDRLISCCLTGQDTILVCTKQATFYLLDLKNLEVISIVDYCSKCVITRNIEIISCQCPYIIDECDTNLPNLVRLITQTSKFSNKIYLYDVVQQRNVMESPIIQNPILFCLYQKGSIEIDLKNKLNNMTLLIIEENYENQPENNNQKSTANFKNSNLIKQPQKTDTTLLNFYKPLKEVPRQLIQSASSFQKLNQMQTSESLKE
ncbi:hypothetical protein TTHERM_00666580 (macronuclear) [Tetrahymena thermophila SB210]|uniref:Uncharacterized protein n=1 Tax=Tetrahymena thermophila (strain SB210) TaxID=312017 RepID=Q23TC4_TETTS|nr:hypothetical protein TTHERM_00666580 [Tetrahymena thermophila SB210]EAR99782.2 hypothetical protein TTHERM_00666580 [Tetrahymena thermophila SB210]|eukprot:XP_001020027.2 hypothetical protein TTHERM_00666580 [Tetrahymena thermophila SB210]